LQLPYWVVFLVVFCFCWKSAALYLFIASLLGVIVTMIHALSIGIDFGLGEIIGVILMPIVVAAFLMLVFKACQE